MNILAVMCQFYAQVEIVSQVSKNNFWPVPEVDSAIVKFKINAKYCTVAGTDEKDFFKLVKIGFSAKRKMLKNNLSGGLRLPINYVADVFNKLGLNLKIRAQELSLDDWVNLIKELKVNVLG